MIGIVSNGQKYSAAISTTPHVIYICQTYSWIVYGAKLPLVWHFLFNGWQIKAAFAIHKNKLFIGKKCAFYSLFIWNYSSVFLLKNLFQLERKLQKIHDFGNNYDSIFVSCKPALHTTNFGTHTHKKPFNFFSKPKLENCL